jgi:putative protease
MPSGNNRDMVLETMENMKGEPVEVAPGSGYQVRIPIKDIDGDTLLIAKYL